MITGKPLDLGGSQGRAEATGHGVVTTLREAARDLGIDPAGATAAVQGFGNVGRHAALELVRRGCKVIAISDRRGAVHSPGGLDLDALIAHRSRTGSVADFPGSKPIDARELFAVQCDFLIPAALEDAITADIARDVRARIVAEGANGPTTQEAGKILHDRGVCVVPDVLANAGGVTVSYFEWVQNRQEYYWSRQEVIDKLDQRMTSAYRQVADRSRDQRISLRQAAYETAIERVVQVTLERGVQ
jgi:glutamate dehydrogenase/leucine dehydrogenase